jgi:integrase
MKGRREHVVPLSARCLEILEEARALRSPLLFPSPQTGEALADMTLVWVLRDMALKDRATVSHPSGRLWPPSSGWRASAPRPNAGRAESLALEAAGCPGGDAGAGVRRQA